METTLTDLFTHLSNAEMADEFKKFDEEMDEVKATIKDQRQQKKAVRDLKASRPDLHYQKGVNYIRRNGNQMKKVRSAYNKTKSAGFALLGDEHMGPSKKNICNQCAKPSKYGYKNKEPITCYEHRAEGMKDVYSYICIVDGCITGGTYGRDGKKCIYCSQHGKQRGAQCNEKMCMECDKIQPSWRENPDSIINLCANCAKLDKYPDSVTSNNMCIICDEKSPSYGPVGGRRQWCSDCGKKNNGVDLSGKKCIVCKIINASFNVRGETPLYCQTCGEEELGEKCWNVKATVCEICDKRYANFGEENNRIKRWCGKCIKENHELNGVLITGRCIHINSDTEHRCRSQPCMGVVGGKMTHCTKHATDEMILLRKIQLCECGKHQPHYGYNGKFTCCVGCKKDDMDRRQKYCYRHDDFNCKTIPLLGYVMGQPISCAKHCSLDMTDVVHRKCECGGNATCGYRNSLRTHCAKCKLDGMVLLNHKLCDQCDHVATYAFEGEKPYRCCEHQDDLMIDVVNKRCSECKLTTIAYNREKCTYCSNSPYAKIQEIKVVNFLREKQLSFIHNKRIGSCRTRPDIHIKKDGYHIIVEVDEKAHSSLRNYPSEEYRMKIIHIEAKGKCVFIRYNPDTIWINRHKKDVPQEVRLKKLYRIIQHYIKHPVKQQLKVVKLFYPNKVDDNVQKYVLLE